MWEKGIEWNPMFFMLNYRRIIASAIIEHGEQLETYVDNTSGSKKDKGKTKVLWYQEDK